MTPLSELMNRCIDGIGTAALADVGDDWMQGRSVFGGLQAALALRAMRTLVPEMPLRTLQVTFVAPVGAGDMRASAKILRAGKNATQVEARIGGDDTLALAVAVFGTARDSIVRVGVPTAAAAGAGTPVPFVQGLWPNFIQHFEMALVDGALPFAGARVDRVVYALSLRDSGLTREAHLLAFADLMPPVGLSWMPQPVPGSSVTWMLEIIDPDFAAQPLRGWRVDARLIAAHDGYTNQSTTIYAPNGKAVALSRQSMVVFG
jgi:acyl-CoA thioesterase